MNPITSALENAGHPRILVIGDAMLDRYTWGHAERVSPEAPVLILRADERDVRLGGAASVAMLLRALEADVTLASVIGNDHDGRTIRRLMDETGIDATALMEDADRSTTTKERFLGRSDHRQPHQMLRVDTESREPLDDELAERLLESIVAMIPQQAAVLISDYAKGVCIEAIVSEVVKCCRDAAIPVLVDPARGVSFDRYSHATLVKPNRLEAELAFGKVIRSPDDAVLTAASLRERYEFESVIITLDRDGLVVASAAGVEHQPINPREVCDITGAGDSVLATLGFGFATQLPLPMSAHLANLAAGLQVGQPGVTPISRAALLREFQQSSPVDPSTGKPIVGNRTAFRALTKSKIITLDDAQRLSAEYRSAGKTVVFTNGCFDLLHIGHVSMLEQAARAGDVLFVAINSDDGVRRLKGADRPVINERDRARMLSALESVDHVLIFDDDTPHRLLEALRPDLLVKGGTTTEIVGREVVERHGGRVERTGELPGISTTQLLSQIHSPRAVHTEQEVQ